VITKLGFYALVTSQDIKKLFKYLSHMDSQMTAVAYGQLDIVFKL